MLEAPTPSTLRFFALALGITWTLQLPAVLALLGVISGPPERFLPLVGLGAFGPVSAAVIVPWIESGRGGVREVFRPMRTWRVGIGWYALALGLFWGIHVAGTAVYAVLGGHEPGRWFYPPENGAQIAAMIMMPLVEEPGWRGVALPRLQRRHGPLRASLVLGVLWAFWHAMMFVLQGFSPLMFAIAVLNIVAGSVVFTWFYNRTRGSLLLAVLAHVGAHLDNPNRALPGNMVPVFVYTAAVVVAACVVVIADRAAWRESPAALAAAR